MGTEGHIPERFPEGEGVSLEELLEGSHEVIDRVYEDYFPSVRRLVTRNSGVHEDAEDVFQEALLVIYSKGKRERLRLTCSLGTYLYAVARKIWLQKLTSRRTKRRIEHEVAEPQVVRPSDPNLEEARKALYKKHFEGLRPDCQKVLRLAFHGKTLEEIAVAMGYKNDSYAKTKKFNCKELLKRRIKADPRYNDLFD